MGRLRIRSQRWLLLYKSQGDSGQSCKLLSRQDIFFRNRYIFSYALACRNRCQSNLLGYQLCDIKLTTCNKINSYLPVAVMAKSKSLVATVKN